MKKMIMMVVAIGIMFFANYQEVLAEDVYYVNSKGVSFTKKEYDYFSTMYWDGYQEKLNQEDFDYIADLGLFDSKITTVSISIPTNPLLRSTIVDKSRTLNMNKSCTSNCLISLQAVWNVDPLVKSYDVIGARIRGVSFVKIDKAYVSGDNYFQEYSLPDIKDNGFGYSLQLVNNKNLNIHVSFFTKTGGTIYGAYEHATQNVPITTSRLYTINSTGQGGVFSFYGAAASSYDNARGVELSV